MNNSNQKKTFLSRKKIVEDNVKEFQSIKGIIQKYIFYWNYYYMIIPIKIC